MLMCDLVAFNLDTSDCYRAMLTSRAFHRVFSRAPLHRHIEVPDTRPIGLVCQLLYDRLCAAPEVGKWIRLYSLANTFRDLDNLLGILGPEAYNYLLSWQLLPRMPNLVTFCAPHFPAWYAPDLISARMQDIVNRQALVSVSLANDYELADETLTLDRIRALFTMPSLKELCLESFTLRPFEISSSALGATILSLDLALCRCNIIDLDGFFSSFPNLDTLRLTDFSNIRQDELIPCLLRRYRTLTSLNLHEMFEDSDASDVIGADWIAGFPMLENLAISGSGLGSTSLLYLTRRTVSVDVRSAAIDRGALAYAVSRWAKTGELPQGAKYNVQYRMRIYET